MLPPILQNLLGAEEQRGADGRLIETAGVEPAGSGRFQRSEKFQGQIHLSETPVDQQHVDLHEEEKAGERSALAKAGFGFHGLGERIPYVALLLRQLPPPGGDGAEIGADTDLSWSTGINRDKSGVGVLAKPVALPNSVPALARLRNIKDFHN